MDIYIYIQNNEVQGDFFTSLKALCRRYGLSYSSASKGRMKWETVKPYAMHGIVVGTLNKIEGRSSNFKKTKKI